MFVEIFDSFNEVHKAAFISALNFLLVILVSWGCMKALRKGVQTRIIAIPFGLALIPIYNLRDA
ncbi:hypothetical protein [Desulfosporosinus meridiei]|uniref:Uncharacterized protein n=1 Tax=Desulfosporosinus meridiei (strain ATCC BAA-275 / DSM 13257 / KCTC 12902 / NCIMB 13706 / S10) TaxID=768704 RepID=J7IXQ7_DESMD|nr:hypothetical protein [Desulfosporosinus meridiei]AFQ43883.1 hypothetical protein Desmer_1929 [Desulfosporosinus meridiei DSM 13257]